MRCAGLAGRRAAAGREGRAVTAVGAARGVAGRRRGAAEPPRRATHPPPTTRGRVARRRRTICHRSVATTAPSSAQPRARPPAPAVADALLQPAGVSPVPPSCFAESCAASSTRLPACLPPRPARPAALPACSRIPRAGGASLALLGSGEICESQLRLDVRSQIESSTVLVSRTILWGYGLSSPRPLKHGLHGSHRPGATAPGSPHPSHRTLLGPVASPPQAQRNPNADTMPRISN